MNGRMSRKLKKVSRSLVALGVCLSLSMTTCPIANAGLKDSMNDIFNSMTNTSKPGIYEGVSRGVLTGGELSIHNRIVNANIFTIVPPDWKIGCGGIDFFGGSFSMINADQLVQLMRAIAANAAGYAFSLAIDAISTMIGYNIKNFLAQIQDWVRQMNNSCTAAKAMVDGIANTELMQAAKMEFKRACVEAGLCEDDAAGQQKNNEVQGAKTEAGKKKLGNIVYRAIVEQNASSWVKENQSKDEEFALEMMSLFGTVIVRTIDKKGDTVEAKDIDSKQEEMSFTVEHRGPILTFKEVFDGGEQSIYTCAGPGNKDDLDTYCTQPKSSDKKIDLPPIRYKFMDILLGPDYRTTHVVKGAVDKWHRLGADLMSPTERYLISNIPSTISTAFWKLAKENPTKAAEFIEAALPSLTIEMLNNMVGQLGALVLEAINGAKGDTQKVKDEVERNSRKITKDVEDLRKEYGDLASLVSKFNAIQQATFNEGSARFGTHLDSPSIGNTNTP